MKKLPVLVIRFKNNISLQEIPLFRGAVLSKIPSDLVLFHNHIGNGLRYRYPLIQYKRIGGHAAIVCIGEGTETIGTFFKGSDFHFKIGQREEQFTIDSIQANQYLIQTWDSEFHYTLRKWLPFNSDNYAKYMQLDELSSKIDFLEKILVGNILSMCSGLGIHIDEQIACKITRMFGQQFISYKGVKMLALDVEFKANMSLPNYIGLGKGVSLGMGMVVRKNKGNNEI